MTYSPPGPPGKQDALMATRERRFQGMVVFFAVLFLYGIMLPPTVTRGGDCGELTSVSWNLGVAHPSGYAMYTMAGKLFASLLPIGEIAWRYNLFSALLASTAVALIAVTAHRLLGPGKLRAVWASTGAALLLAGSYYFGSQALIAEVYALNAVMLATMLWCAVAWYQDADWRWFYFLALMVSFSLVTHLSCVFLVPSLVLITVWARRDRFRGGGFGAKKALVSMALLLIGGTMLFYFPARSRLFPEPPRFQPLNRSIYWPLDWGHPVDLSRVKTHATAQQYKALLVQPAPVNVFGKEVHVPLPVLPLNEWPARIAKWAGFGAVQLLWASPFILLGAWASWRNRTLGAALLLVVLLNAVQFGYMVSDLPNFFFATYVVFSIWLAYGFSAAAQWIGQLPPGARWRLRFSAQFGLVITVLCQWVLFASTSGWHGLTIARDAAREQAAGTERVRAQTGKPAIIVLPTDDILFAYWYVRYVEGRGGGAITPWGRALRTIKEGGDLAPDLKVWNKTNPVVTAGLVPSMEHKFHYEPANESGNLWRLSETPVLATPVTSSSKPLNSSGLVAAKIRRHPIWRPESGEFPQILRGGLAALDVQVDAAAIPDLRSNSPVYVQILSASREHFSLLNIKTPSPQQKTVSQGKDFDTEVPVWRQTREVSLPAGTTSGVWRTAIPFQADDDAPAKEIDVWARVTTTPESNVPWTKIDTIKMVTR